MDEYRELDGWTVRVHVPTGGGIHPVILLLHGWTGDENSMWIFTSKLPQDAYWIAPRGLYPTPLGGFGWQEQQTKVWPEMADLRPAVEKILSELLVQEHFPDADFSVFNVIGFSQGAALAFSLAVLRPERVSRVAGLAGFLPIDASAFVQNGQLEGVQFYIAHGTGDTLVPVERAHKAIEVLETGGGSVAACLDDVGHKLGPRCFQGLGEFINARLDNQDEY